MNIDYLISVIELYTNEEENSINKTQFEITKIKYGINCKFIITDINNPTNLVFPYEEIMKEDNLKKCLNIFKNDSIVVIENNTYDTLNDSCNYYVSFSNNRILNIKDFSLVETNNIRNIIYGINYEKEKLRIPYQKEELVIKHNQLRESGYLSTSFTLLVITFILTVIVIIVIVFKIV